MSRFLRLLDDDTRHSPEWWTLWRECVVDTLAERGLAPGERHRKAARRFVPYWRLITDDELMKAAAILCVPLFRNYETEDEEIAGRYREGASLPDLAREYRKGPATIRQIVLDHGIPIRSKGCRIKTDTIKLMAAMRDAGETFREIGIRFGMSKQGVAAALKRLESSK